MSEYAVNKANGSILDHSEKTGQDLQEVLMGAEHVIMFDSSLSMKTWVSDSNKTRYDLGREQLENLQAQLSWKIVLISYQNNSQFNLNGYPAEPTGSTFLNSALTKAKDFDSDVTFYIISDGEHWDHSTALETAKTFESTIHTIFIGDDNSYSSKARKCLEEIANATGGKHQKSEAEGLFEKEFLMLSSGE